MRRRRSVGRRHGDDSAFSSSAARVFEDTIATLEQRVRAETSERVPLLGEKAPKAWSAVWALLESMYRYATCAQGCPGRDADHTFRYIAGRAVNVGLGAISATASGWYDTCLISCRVLGEQANLVTLLIDTPDALAVFKHGDKRARMTMLGPKAVREKLAARQLDVVTSKNRAELLSERVIHPAFESITATHSPAGLIVGPVWQKAGLVLCVNEMIVALAGFLALARDPTASAVEAADLRAHVESLSDGLGSVLIDNLPPGLQHHVPEDRWKRSNDETGT